MAETEPRESYVMNPITTLLTVQLQMYSERNDQLTAENNELKQKNDDLKNENTRMKRNVEHREGLKQKTRGLEQEIQGLEQEIQGLEQKIQLLELELTRCNQRKEILGSVSRVKTIRKAGVGHYIDRFKNNVKAKFENKAKRDLKVSYRQRRDAQEQQDRDAAREYAFGKDNEGHLKESYSTPLLERVKRVRKPMTEDQKQAKAKRDHYRQIKKTTRNWKSVTD
jgi:prefoldin subunit 5